VKVMIMKRYMAAILPIVAAILTAGCQQQILPMRQEIDDLQLVEVLGIDKSTELPGYQVITIASRKLEEPSSVQKPQQDQQEGSGGEGEITLGNKAFISTAQGRTLFEAARIVSASSGKQLFWAHTKYYLIGEEAARDNIAKYIDFIVRDHQFHINNKVYVVKGSAKELIEQVNKSELYIADKLDSLAPSVTRLGTSEELSLAELMRFIDIHFGSARIPCIELVDRSGGKGKSIPAVESFGYAIVSNLKLVSFIGRDISRGVNLISNNLQSSIVVVKDLYGEDASLEIIAGSTEVIPKFSGDELEELTLKAKVISNLGEVQSQKPTVFEENLAHMKAQLSAILKNEMMRALEIARESESDCLGISDMLRLKHPVRFHKIEDRWMEIFLQLPIRIEVEAQLRRSHELDEPSGMKGIR